MASTRKLSLSAQTAAIYGTDLKRLLRAKKTLVLLATALLPVLFALFYVLLDDIDGLSLFSNTVEQVIYPFIIPLVAIFYGGPVVVDEIEGRTLTYLTLRPVPKPALYLGKWLAALGLVLGLVLLPLLGLLGIVALGAGGVMGSLNSIAKIILAASLGAAAYTAIFAALGALSAKSLFPSIIYFIIFEIICSALPIFEVVSVRFHMRTVAEFHGENMLGKIGAMLLQKPLVAHWSVGALILVLVCAGGALAGASIFSRRQYQIK